MDDIDNQVKSINDAITVIDQIAFQTNILSLNAAVEAATAGVKLEKDLLLLLQKLETLANRSADAAKEKKYCSNCNFKKQMKEKSIANNMIGGYSI